MPVSDETVQRAPIRTCIGCRTRRRPDEMTRVAMVDGRLSADRHVGGRGAWICPANACVEAAIKRRALARALRCSPSSSLDDDLRTLTAGVTVFPPGPQS